MFSRKVLVLLFLAAAASSALSEDEDDGFGARVRRAVYRHKHQRIKNVIVGNVLARTGSRYLIRTADSRAMTCAKMNFKTLLTMRCCTNPPPNFFAINQMYECSKDSGRFDALTEYILNRFVTSSTQNEEIRRRMADELFPKACLAQCIFNKNGLMLAGKVVNYNAVVAHFQTKVGTQWQPIVEQAVGLCENVVQRFRTNYVRNVRTSKECNLDPFVLTQCVLRIMSMNCPTSVENKFCGDLRTELQTCHVASAIPVVTTVSTTTVTVMVDSTTTDSSTTDTLMQSESTPTLTSTDSTVSTTMSSATATDSTSSTTTMSTTTVSTISTTMSTTTATESTSSTTTMSTTTGIYV